MLSLVTSKKVVASATPTPPLPPTPALQAPKVVHFLPLSLPWEQGSPEGVCAWPTVGPPIGAMLRGSIFAAVTSLPCFLHQRLICPAPLYTLAVVQFGNPGRVSGSFQMGILFCPSPHLSECMPRVQHPCPPSCPPICSPIPLHCCPTPFSTC